MDWVWYSWGAYLHCFRPSWKSSKSDLKGAGASQATVFLFCFVFFLFFTSLSLVRKHHGKVLAKCGPQKGVISLQGGLWSGASFLVFLIKREREKMSEKEESERKICLSCHVPCNCKSPVILAELCFWIKWDTMKLNCLLSKLDSGFLHTAGIDMRRVWRLLPWPGTLPTATT